jgi:hypothetical protein
MVGSVVIVADQGLGVLARSFFENGIISRVLMEVKSYRLNHFEWYPGASIYTPENIDPLLEGLDVLLIFEKLADWSVALRARELGIRIVLMPMYEITPEQLPLEPDHYLAPSAIDLDRYATESSASMITVPVEVPWRHRSRARVFVHNSGTIFSFFRNGTMELLQALPLVKSPIKLILRMQDRFEASRFQRHARRDDVPLCTELLAAAEADPRVDLRIGTAPWEGLWEEGDVFIFPEIYNGLSLPLQEAYAAGMLVMAGDRYPINTWLPKEPLIPVSHYEWGSDFSIPVRHAIFRPRDIAERIDEWFDADIESFSHRGRSWAQENSWDALREAYLDCLSGKTPIQSNAERQ